MINHLKISKDFWLDEFQCKGENCCDHLVKIDSEIIKLLEKLHKQVGKSITILRGYCCPKYNKEIGGQPNDYYLSGMAVRITVSKFDTRELARLAFSVGFSTVIAYPNRGFVYLDVRRKGLGLVGGGVERRIKWRE